MVITYEDANRAVKALIALREAKVEDKQLMGMTGKSNFIYYTSL